jgi:hypothetical protein
MLYRYTIALVGKRLISAITILFLAIQSQGQQSIEVIQGQRTAITIPIKSWKADSADPVLKINTRDEKTCFGKRIPEDFKSLIHQI